LDRAIRALGTIDASKRPDLFWIANAASRAYRQQVEELASSHRVNLVIKIGVSDSDVVDLLNRASAMIYTPLLEPFGFAPLEANACQTPVVAIAEGGVRETIEDGMNGILVGEDDPVRLGEAVLLLLERPDLAREMGARGREYVLDKWSWKAAVDRLEASLMGLHKQTGLASA
jgi:glycosyltransferase involved in cell wall biosynthesis